MADPEKRATDSELYKANMLAREALDRCGELQRVILRASEMAQVLVTRGEKHGRPNELLADLLKLLKEAEPDA